TPGFGNSNVFVAKFDPSQSGGNSLVYSTFLGGKSSDVGYGIAVDAAGSAYVTGLASSVDFPTTSGALQKTLAGSINAFVTKFTLDGSALVFSTFVGGKIED